MRRAIPLLFGLVLASCGAPAATGGGGIVSTNPCADALLVRLVPPARIAAISHYSHDPASSSLPQAVAHQFRTTAGTAEEVIALKPDLVVVDTLTPLASRAAYARAGLRVLMLDSPTSIAASRAQILALADAVGASARGQALAARIDAAIAAAAPPAGTHRPGTLMYIGGDLANGPGTLLDELMTRAGLRDAAPDYGLAHSGVVASEALVVRPPALILTPDATERRTAMRQRLLAGRTRFAVFPRRLINCGGPAIIPAMARLAAIRRGAA